VTTSRWSLAAIGTGFVLALALGIATNQLPAIGAGALLHPTRSHTTRSRPQGCRDEAFEGDGVRLQGWRCHASGGGKATLVYLHGVADNRASATGVVERFGRRGFDVLAFDSRAHGDSEGEACTYGFFEKRDLHRILDTVAPGPIVLVGTSLGAAVALQEAATDRRVTAVVAAETFSDIRTVAAERAPFFFTPDAIERSFRLAEQQAGFRADDVSCVIAAATIRVPVLLIHGTADADTPPAHSQRVLAALAGPKRLILVPGAGHNESLRGDVWNEIERWIDEVLGSPAPGAR
jgi:pimeloyl-ACP methyl ester carboxylesterase